jgi:energy-coupling factor transporter ATP-binding protein EcfA2
MRLCSKVNVNEINSKVAEAFDYEFHGEVITDIEGAADIATALSGDFGIGLIVGPSGSGKSTLAKTLGLREPSPEWDNNESICSHFDSVEDAQDKLGAVGLNSIPSWMKPFFVLSTGEKFRATLARSLSSYAFIDEFTSVVDRTVAKACSKSVRKYADRTAIKSLVFASCHYDIIEWLQPDWVFDTATGEIEYRGSLRRFPEIRLDLCPCGWQEWARFREHHYLDANINKAAWCWLVSWGDVVVAFAAAIPLPSGTLKNAWRGHRTVVLPDFQGLGIGVRVSDAVAKMMVASGKRYFSKTAHARLGRYREGSEEWKPTSKNKRIRGDHSKKRASEWTNGNYKHSHKKRVCYSHEYIG